MLEQLQAQGWHLLPAGLERLLEGANGPNIDVKQAIKLALDTDLREIGGGAFGSIAARGSKADTFDGNIVAQILKIRNISAPKANEESKVAPRLLKITLTDGQTQYSALEGENVPSVSLDTPPGTKIYLKNGPIKISQGLLMLNANNVSVLGGRVHALVEKWELTRAMAKYAKGGRMQLSTSGPPPWIAFGQKIQQNLPNDKNFKSLQTKEKDESKENTEFNALRNDAIAEATKLGTKKTFGGGAKQMVDANVQKIMDKGFSEDQAVHALKLTRNNVHRALSNLQRIEERNKTHSDIKAGKIEPPLKLGKRGLAGKRDAEPEGTAKPSTKVSLFDFLEDILPETESTAKKSTSKETTPFSGKDSKGSTDSYANKQASSNSYPSTNTNNSRYSSSGAGGNSSNQYPSNSNSNYNSSSNKSYNQQRFENNQQRFETNQQRFENNISSSFANRNTTTGPGNRNYNQQSSQQQQQPYQQSSNASSGYKQQDYNSRYRGPPSNANQAGDAPPPRGRPDSKYNQSSYNQSQQQSQYRTDNYNNNNTNNSNPNSGGGGYGSKYNQNMNSGKNQPSNNNYGYAQVDNRNSQGYGAAAQGDSRKYPNGPANHYQQQPQQQQQQQQQQSQSSYHSGGNKPVQGYNASNANQSHAINQYGQQTTNNGAVGNSSANVSNAKPQKGARYGKEEPQKFSGPPPNSAPPQGRKPPPPKGQNPPQQQSSGAAAPATGGSQQPFVPANKQPSTTPTGNNNKMSQLTDATANMQIASKSFNNTNAPPVMNTAKPPQGGSMGGGLAGPAQPPSAAPTAAPVVSKNFIQLPNGFNYNPYQIMGFQNKQTNEFALNVLKSQQFDALQQAHLATPGQPGVPPVQAVTGPMTGVAIPPAGAVVQPVLAATPTGPATVHPSMQATAPSGMPVWKVGDRCLAKYWEDGGFYNAEITGISENTFVVCFLEYGNYEEVLKTDCIPLTQPGAPATATLHGPPPAMSFHHPPTASHLQPGAPLMAPPPTAGGYPGPGADSQSGQHYAHGGYKPQMGQYPHHPMPHHQSQQQQRPPKFREQRPMYVPPAQRK